MPPSPPSSPPNLKVRVSPRFCLEPSSFSPHLLSFDVTKAITTSVSWQELSQCLWAESHPHPFWQPSTWQLVCSGSQSAYLLWPPPLPPPIKGWLGDFNSSLTFFTLGFLGKVTVLSLSLLPGLWSPRNRKSMALEPNKNGFQTSSVHFLLWDYTFELLQDYGENFYMWNIYMYGGSKTYLESSELFFFFSISLQLTLQSSLHVLSS